MQMIVMKQTGMKMFQMMSQSMIMLGVSMKMTMPKQLLPIDCVGSPFPPGFVFRTIAKVMQICARPSNLRVCVPCLLSWIRAVQIMRKEPGGSSIVVSLRGPAFSCGVVSDVQRNLISAGQVVRQGWSLVMNEDSLEVRSPEMVLAASMWAGCPWMKSSVKRKKKRVSFADGPQDMDVNMFTQPLQEQPGSSCDPQPEPVPDVVMEEDSPQPSADYGQQTKRMQVELELHRRRGHFPRHPECEACRVSKSVVQHRPDVFPDTKHHVEVFADFCFIETDDGSQAKFLALKERVSGMIGAVYCGENTDRIKSNLRAFFDLGLQVSQEPRRHRSW